MPILQGKVNPRSLIHASSQVSIRMCNGQVSESKRHGRYIYTDHLSSLHTTYTSFEQSECVCLPVGGSAMSQVSAPSSGGARKL